MKTQFFKIVSLLLCVLLIAAIAISCISCGAKAVSDDTAAPDTATVVDDTAEDTAATAETNADGKILLGEGATQFDFVVKTADGTETTYLVSTDDETVGAALLATGIIEGEVGEYGLYVKTVQGETHDYDVDGTYWSFLINGEYAMTGVDATPVEAGAVYTFEVGQ